MVNAQSVSEPAPAATPFATTLVLVPFAPPNNKDDKLEFATEQFIKKLVARGLTVGKSAQMDLLDVSGQAAEICEKYHATGVLAGTVRHEQNQKFLTGTMATHAEIRFTRFDCSGKSVWKGYAVGDKDYAWSNPAAAVSDVIAQALDSIVVQLQGSISVTK